MKCLFIHKDEDAENVLLIRRELAVRGAGIDFDVTSISAIDAQGALRLVRVGYDVIVLPLSNPIFGALRLAELMHTFRSQTRLILWRDTQAPDHILLKLFDAVLPDAFFLDRLEALILDRIAPHRLALLEIEESLAAVLKLRGRSLADYRQAVATAPRSPAHPSAPEQQVDFAIITTREDEFRAVLDKFRPEREREARRRYRIASVEAKAIVYSVALVRCPEQGEGEAQRVATDVILDLNPGWILLVGIAGAVPAFEYTLGDVVAATRIYDFCVEAALPDRTRSYAIAGGPAHRDVQDLLADLPAMDASLRDWNSEASVGESRPGVSLALEMFYGDTEWKKKVTECVHHHFGAGVGQRRPIATAGPVASSDRLVKDPELLASWLQAARQVHAIEMELAGVYRASMTKERWFPVLAIRGISDIVGFKREPRWTSYACRTAAAFTYALVTSGAIKRGLPSVPSKTVAPLAVPAPASPPRLGAIRLTRSLEVAGGWQALGIWVAEMQENLKKGIAPLLEIEIDGERETRAALAQLEATQEPSLDEREARLRLNDFAEDYGKKRRHVERLATLLMTKECLRHSGWRLGYPQKVPVCIEKCLEVLGGRQKDDPWAYAFNVYREAPHWSTTVHLTKEECDKLLKRASVPEPEFLTGSHPLSDFPDDVVVGKVLPSVLLEWHWHDSPTNPDYSLPPAIRQYLSNESQQGGQDFLARADAILSVDAWHYGLA